MKKYKLSFVQGRLSPQIGSYFQYFPIDNWENELKVANKIGLKNIEWIISDLSNPLFNKTFFKIIKRKLYSLKLSISSISLDFLMREPLYLSNTQDLNWLITKLNNISKHFKSIRINVPIEENSSIYNTRQLNKVKKNLIFLKNKLSKNFILSLETDLTPNNIIVLLNNNQFKGIGLNIDIGNIEANGYDIEEYFSKLRKFIFGIHIKNRDSLFSNSKMLKNKKNLNFICKNLYKLENLNDITLQTYKDNKKYKNQFISNLKLIKHKLNYYDRS